MMMFLLFLLAADKPAPVAPVVDEGLTQLLSVKRVYVDRLTGGETAAQMRDLIISSLQGTRLFVITENQERADAILRGAAEDLVYTEVHSTSDSLSARVSVGRGRSSKDESRSYSGGGAGESESARIEDRRHEAMATVRLVNKDGDVIWSTTQESKGSKFKGSSADVADKVARKLAEDCERARKSRK
jgi:hypothetical protein